jgi:CheY-specific phosphatase CheX
MNRDLNPGLRKAAMEVFEELAFLLPSYELDDICPPFHLGAAVEFQGPISGSLVIDMYGNVIPILAANMLAQEDPPSDFEQRDALKELTNVICGNLLPYLAGKEAVYTIRAPLIREVPDASGAIKGEPAAQFRIGVEQGQAFLQLFLCSETGTLEPAP